MSCPNHPLLCDAYSRFGSAGDALRWYISQPPKWGPLTSHFCRVPSASRTNAPLRVPTSTRTRLMPDSFLTNNSQRPNTQRPNHLGVAESGLGYWAGAVAPPFTLSSIGAAPDRQPHTTTRRFLSWTDRMRS